MRIPEAMLSSQFFFAKAVRNKPLGFLSIVWQRIWDIMICWIYKSFLLQTRFSYAFCSKRFLILLCVDVT